MSPISTRIIRRSSLTRRCFRWRVREPLLRSPCVRAKRHRKAATTVELAVVAPVFFLVVFAVFEFGRAVMLRQALTDAARAACRTATLVTTLDTTRPVQAAQSSLEAIVQNPASAAITVTPSNLAAVESGDAITTAVGINYSNVSWIPSLFIGDVELRGEAAMIRE